MANRAIVITCHNPVADSSRYPRITNLFNTTVAFCKDMELSPLSILNEPLANVRTKVQAFAKNQTSSDTTYIFLHCHGGVNGLRLGYNKSSNTPNESISFADLKALFDTIPGIKNLFIDSCHSGSAISSSTASKARSLTSVSANAAESTPESTNETIISVFGGSPSKLRSGEFRASNYRVLCACGNSETAWCGYATIHWLTGLGWNTDKSIPAKMEADTTSDNAVTLKELYDYSYAKMAAENSAQHIQRYPTTTGILLMQKYVVDFYIYSSSSKSRARSSHPDGYVLVDRDLNTGAGGDYIYMSYKLGPASRAFTHFLCSWFGSSKTAGNVTLTDKDKTSATYYRIGVDLNRRAGGKYIYLNVSRTAAHKPITNVGVVFGGADVISPWETVNWDNGRGHADVNKGAGGKYICIIERH